MNKKISLRTHLLDRYDFRQSVQPKHNYFCPWSLARYQHASWGTEENNFVIRTRAAHRQPSAGQVTEKLPQDKEKQPRAP